MIPEFAHFLTCVAFVCTVVLTLAGFYTGKTQQVSGINICRSVASLQFVVLLMSFGLLMYSFLTDDFSVLYVSQNSTVELPWYYKFSATWGAHEGSFLFWTVVTAGWTFLVALKTKSLSMDMGGYVLGVMGAVNTGFLAYLLTASNPFLRLVPSVPDSGADLNVILQDIGLIIHPPMLSIGYVGFSVAFAFAIAALLTGRIDATWARWSRPWTHAAWAFLTVGIALGSWWAYYELGWGGWWFWDPAENASFMPWLAGTALIHSLSVTEKRGAFKSWTVLLAILAFGLSLTGGFLIRSGVLTSVHAFAIDPERGLFLLAILVTLMVPALVLFAVRASTLKSRIQYAGVSRELLLLLNNALLVFALVNVLIFTIYPLIHEWISGGELTSIGPPYFNAVFVPVMLFLTACLAITPIVRWKRTPLKLLKNALILLGLSVAFVILVGLVLSDQFVIGALLVAGLALWVIVVHIKEVIRRRTSMSLGITGMFTAHIGFAVAVIGIAITTGYTSSTEERMRVGDTVELNDRTYEFLNIEDIRGPNYIGQMGTFKVGDIYVYPERREYLTRQTITTEAGIDGRITRDLFIALGEPLPDGSWGVRIQEKPLVRWIWLGAFIMALGGILAVMDARYRKLQRRYLQAKFHSDDALPSSALATS